MKYVTWGAMALVSLVMLAGGGGKLAGVPMMHDSFATLGLPAWFGYFIGACEVAGAIGIWLRRTSMLAAFGIAIIMVGAVYYHVAHTPWQEGITAAVVLVFCAWIVSRRGSGIF